MIEYLFLDLDDTILDFHRQERKALRQTFQDFGLLPTEEILNRYHAINKWHWEQLELKKLTRPQVLTGRFQMLFDEVGVKADPAAITAAYAEHLAEGHFFLPGAEEAVEGLSKKYRLFLASNGTASVQKGRLTSANLYRFFEQVFVSQEIGHDKPAREFFEVCFSRIPGFDPAKAMIVGDSLTSDMRGGNNAGLKTCWVNPGHAKRDPQIHIDYEIEALAQLPALLESL